MALMEWQATFETGIEEFDEHHKYLVYLLNLAHDCVVLDAEPDEVQAVISELIKYVDYHFSAEEHWMEMHNYPDLASHKGEHTALTEKVFAFNNDFMNGKVDLSTDLIQFLMQWVATHILESDARCGLFAQQHRL
ncbi:bacteriohemerythrin [Geobacter sp. SVR]|uniref:bacteriohemerythrin n=1 Tax=Geobacter sp. SVR TaxID=2495594 RepID=UPI00143F0366|nr:bacteriohemerythrin [Geobacter sp. SVR]BCS53635.1 hypothetical protein GSVR_19430 [Geobacter sp. SVR]GCF84168.1 hemerythrin [Geobacter sp. SVR]